MVVQDSTEPAESPDEMVWMKNTTDCKSDRTAENGPILHSFLMVETTGRKSHDCYTFEQFAPRPDVIRTNYYYHYKRNILGLKEETTWS
jgi:hypothetical protein